MPRLDFSRTDTFIPLAWIVVKGSAALIVANLWWLNSTTPTSTVSAIAPDVGGAAAHRVLAAFAMVAVLLETHADACFSGHVCARGVFADAEALTSALRLLLDVFVVNLLLRATAPHVELECLEAAATCWAWALFSGLLGLADAVAAHALRSASVVCVVILAAATAATPCFAAEYRTASFAHIVSRFCAYVLCAIARCYVRALCIENTHQYDKTFQRARVIPNVALFGWLFVASPHVLAVCGVVFGCACVWGAFGTVPVLDECAGFRKAPGGDVVAQSGGGQLTIATPSTSPLPPPLAAHFTPVMQPVHLNDDLAERLRSIEESVPTGRRRAAAAMFG